MPPKENRTVERDTKFDRRSTNRVPRPGVEDRRSDATAAEDDARPRKRRATRDGREPLVVYMLPDAIKALKIAALQLDTTASAIVSEAVSAWLETIAKRRPKGRA
jgi:hypothetical protein